MSNDLVDNAGRVLDAAGVLAILVGALIAPLVIRRGRGSGVDTYHRYRRQLGRSILLGLELLVAADIIRTVAVAPTVTSVSVLGGVVLIRTFLSFSLELEISGRWPWQSASTQPDRDFPAGESDG